MRKYNGELVEINGKETTKVCPECGSTDLLLLQTFNEKICRNHSEFLIIPWIRDEDQPHRT